MIQIVRDKWFQRGLVALALCISCASLYFEFIVGLMPCPLCVMQRLAIFLIAFFLLLKLFISHKKSRCAFSILAYIASMMGVFFAGRQVYLQSLPPEQAPACGPSLDMLIKYFPLQDLLHALFYGTGDCAKVDWSFLGGSMAFLSLLVFCFFLFCFTLEAISCRRK